MKREELVSRRIAIYGMGKYQTDFEFVFNWLSIAEHIDPDAAGEDAVLDSLRNAARDSGFVIVCDFDKETAGRRLTDAGLVYQEQWCHGEDLFCLLDYSFLDAARGRKIAVWGTGADCAYFEERDPEIQNYITCYIDADKSKSSHRKNDRPIIHPDDVADWNEYFIIVATVKYYEEIHGFLLSKGLAENRDYAIFSKTEYIEDSRPSAMMRKTVFREKMRRRFCRDYFDAPEAAVRPGGHVDVCCWNNIKIGDLKSSTIQEIWASSAMRIFRLSLLNKTFSFCDMDMCKRLPSLPELSDDIPAGACHSAGRVEPVHLLFAFDRSCNLACITCRPDTKTIMDSYYENAIPTIVRRLLESGCSENPEILVSVASDGEAFFCDSYKKLLFSSALTKRKTINIISNGTLFNEKMLEKLKNIYEGVSVNISVDAATKETYALLRNANWENLMKNLGMLSRERKSGYVTRFIITMVVQTGNVHEMGDFVKLAKALGVDSLTFRDLHISEGMPSRLFQQHSVLHADGSPKQELLKAFKDTILDDPVVEMYPNLHNLYMQFKIRREETI